MGGSGHHRVGGESRFAPLKWILQGTLAPQAIGPPSFSLSLLHRDEEEWKNKERRKNKNRPVWVRADLLPAEGKGPLFAASPFQVP